MLRSIPAEHLDLDGKALAVRYQADPAHPDCLLVSITAHRTDGGPDDVRRAEIRLVAIAERMTPEAMHARVATEAARRDVDCVAWIRDG